MGSLVRQIATPSSTVPDRSKPGGRPCTSESAPSLVTSLFAFALIGLWVAAVFATYTRLPAGELYNVSNSGVVGGASRVVVFLGYPCALASILILGIVWARVRRSPALTHRSRRLVGALIVMSVLLCASVAVPGVVDPDNLNAKPMNALAAAGVLLAVTLTISAAWLAGVGAPERALRGNWLRCAVAIVLLVLAIPWLGAIAGLHLTGLPVLGEVFLSGELRTQPSDPIPPAAVHLGDHEGLDGVLLVLIVLMLSRELRRVRDHVLRTGLIAGGSLAIVYGLAVALKDFWLEQIVKRGWTDFEITGVLEPGVTLGWAGILLATALLAAVAHRRAGRTNTGS